MSEAAPIDFGDLASLQKKILAKKKKQKLSRLSPFWARRQAATDAAAERTYARKSRHGPTRSHTADGGSKPVPFHRQGLSNLRELTKSVPLQEKFRTAHQFMPTAAFKSQPRWDHSLKRSLDGGFQEDQRVNDKGAHMSMTPRVLKFPLQGQGANKYYEGCSTHGKWVDDSKAAQRMQRLCNIPFGSRSKRIFPFDVTKVPLKDAFAQGGIVPMESHQAPPTPFYKLTKRERNQIKRKKLAKVKEAMKSKAASKKKLSRTAAFKDKVKRDPYGLIPFGDGMSDFRQPGPGPATDSSSADRLGLAKGIATKPGGRFKGGSRDTMPVVGQDAPPIWAEPNTLDDVPLEAITKPNAAVPKIAAIDTTQKATNFPECIMVEKQGGDVLYFGHKPWVNPPADVSDKKGAQLHYAFGSYSSRFQFDMGKIDQPESALTSPLPTSFNPHDQGRASAIFRCTEQRNIFKEKKTKKSTLVLEKHDLLDSWNVH